MTTPLLMFVILALPCYSAPGQINRFGLPVSAHSRDFYVRSPRDQVCARVNIDILEFTCCEGEWHEGAGQSCCGKRSFNLIQASCCDGQLTPHVSQLVSDCCGSRAYDPLNQLCCDLQILTRTQPHSKCCGKELYNKDHQLCCGHVDKGRKLLTKMSRYHLCCGDQQFDRRSHCCCQHITEPLNPQPLNASCCAIQELRHTLPAQTVQNKTIAQSSPNCMPGEKPCGQSACFNPITERCCVNPTSLQGQSYSHDQTCCDGTLSHTPGQLTPHVSQLVSDCCGSRACDPLNQCDLQILTRTQPHSKCCGKELYNKDHQLCCGHVDKGRKVLTKMSRHHLCCGDQQFDRRSHCCCQHITEPLNPQPLNASCCAIQELRRTPPAQTVQNKTIAQSSPNCMPGEKPCGQSACFNPITERCCVNPTSLQGQSYSHDQTCCDGTLSHTPGQLTPHVSQLVSDCCGSRACDPLNQCDLQILTRTQPHSKCCGKELYNKDHQLCCGHVDKGRKVLTKMSRHHLCCGDQQFDRRSHCCCQHITEPLNPQPLNASCCAIQELRRTPQRKLFRYKIYLCHTH
ncbi:uncharacterized protein LOC112265075 [Oncorhynchus tshawytscha]|uniref:uncharacterized protein LOC112265075 n=1 Tax=Oncorhynchus tshawytscha TaxID=74940 RepID=UPI001C3D77BC|nr:uncharacterized protein LOC112265075 [Oncorhynchus tshawytscha]